MRSIGYSRSYRPRCATGGNGSRNARSSDLCLSALPLSPLSWPRPHGRTPTIPPVFSNVRRSTTRLQPLRGRGLVPPDKRKTRPESEPVAAATTIASGVIHGRNHAERIVHPQTLGEPADCPIAKCRGHLLVQSPLLSRDDARLEFGHERSDRGRMPLQRSLRRGATTRLAPRRTLIWTKRER